MLNLQVLAADLESSSFEDFTVKAKNHDSLNELNENEENILFFMKDIEKIKYLVEECNVECCIISKNKMSPLFFKEREVIEYMTDRGGIINVEVEYSTPMDLATPQEARDLLAKGYNVNECLFNQYMTRLTYEEEVEKLNILIENGIDLERLSPLIYLADKKYLEVLKNYDLKENVYVNSLKKTGEDSYFFLKMLNIDKEENVEAFIHHNYQDEDEKNKLFKNVILDNMPLLQAGVFTKKLDDILDILTKYTDFDPHTFTISWKPWFFCIDYGQIKSYLDKNNIDFYKQDSWGKTRLFYKISLKDIYEICENNIDFLLKKDNEGNNFAESGYSGDHLQFLEKYIEFPIENWSIEFNKVFFENCIKPLIEGDVKFMHNQVMNKPGVNTISTKWEKKHLLSDMENKNIAVKKINNERI